MTKITASVFTASLLALGLHAAPASALNGRTWVSGLGSDSNPCTRTQPCLTFQGAHDKTAAGGEIDILDPGGYGVVTITKSISIVNDGVGTAGIKPAGGPAITVNAGASDKITLRGLTLDGAGAGLFGIRFNTGASLNVQNCVVQGFLGDGIKFQPNSASNLSVSNTFVADNGGMGIFVLPSGSGNVTAIFNRVEVENNGNMGIDVSGASSTGTIKATVSDSSAAKNGTIGFAAVTTSGQAATSLTVVRSVTANNFNGIAANGPGATLRVGQSTVTGNNFGWTASNSGVVQSYGDNMIDGNTVSETAPPAIANK